MGDTNKAKSADEFEADVWGQRFLTFLFGCPEYVDSLVDILLALDDTRHYSLVIRQVDPSLSPSLHLFLP